MTFYTAGVPCFKSYYFYLTLVIVVYAISVHNPACRLKKVHDLDRGYIDTATDTNF